MGYKMERLRIDSLDHDLEIKGNMLRVGCQRIKGKDVIKIMEFLRENKKSFEKPMIDYNKPIFCKDGSNTYMLVPSVNGTYVVLGYNWLNVADNCLNSSVTWKTKEEAIDAYSYSVIFNKDLTV